MGKLTAIALTASAYAKVVGVERPAKQPAAPKVLMVKCAVAAEKENATKRPVCVRANRGSLAPIAPRKIARSHAKTVACARAGAVSAGLNTLDNNANC